MVSDLSLVFSQAVDVDRLFTNMETVCEVSAALLHRLNEAMAEPDTEAVVIGSDSLSTFVIVDSLFTGKILMSGFYLKAKCSSRQRQV